MRSIGWKTRIAIIKFDFQARIIITYQHLLNYHQTIL